MTNLKNPSVILIPNPTDLDKSIQELQLGLSSISWLEKIFGRAKEVSRKLNNQVLREPMVYQGTSEYYPVLPNDTLKAYSFFRCVNGRSTEMYEPNSPNNYYSVPTDLIVWANIKKIDNSKDYIFTEELIHDVVAILNKYPSVLIQRIWDEKADSIFSGYTLNLTHRDLLMYPYQAFRIEMVLNYKSDC